MRFSLPLAQNFSLPSVTRKAKPSCPFINKQGSTCNHCPTRTTSSTMHTDVP